MTGALILRGLGFAALWWVLAEGRTEAWWLGLAATAAATAASVAVLPPRRGAFHLPAAAGFVGYFLWQSVRGGAQVAAMALRPRLDLRPALVELPLALPPGAPRVLITAALGLMPGTVGVRLEGERLRVHVLDERLPVMEEARKLEARIARLFGVRR
jgi:multicomponent Na+:H+ antiporter subunit E